MTAGTTLLCWTLASVVNILQVNTPDYTKDAAAYGIESWKEPGFLANQTNAARWSSWVHAHWRDLVNTTSGFDFSGIWHLNEADPNPRMLEATFATPTTLGDSKTVAGEIWRVMSGWYVSTNQAVASWVGSTVCGEAPPAPTPEPPAPTPAPTPGPTPEVPKGYVHYEVSKDAQAGKSQIQFGYYSEPSEKMIAGGKLTANTTSNGILRVEATNADQEGMNIVGTLTEEDSSVTVELIGVLPTGISLDFNLSLDKGGYLTYDSPTGYTFKEEAFFAFSKSGFDSTSKADFGLGSGFDSIFFKRETLSAAKKAGQTERVGLGKLTNKGHGCWEATATNFPYNFTFQIKANTDNAERPIPWGNDTEAWAEIDSEIIDYIYGNTPDTLENGQGSNADGNWLSWTIGNTDTVARVYTDIDYRIESWEAGERKKTLATGRLRSFVSTSGADLSSNLIRITYYEGGTVGPGQNDGILLLVGGSSKSIWNSILKYYPSVVPNGTALNFGTVFDTEVNLTADQEWVYLAKGTGFDDTSKITAAGLAGTQTPMFASIRADDGTYWVKDETTGRLKWSGNGPFLYQSLMMHRTTAFSQAPHRNFWKATDEADGSAVSFELDKQGPNPLAAPTRAAVFFAAALSVSLNDPVRPDQMILAVLSKQNISTAIETKTRDQTVSVETFDAGDRVIVGGCSIVVNESMSLKSVAPLGVSWSDTDGHNQPGFIIRYESTGYDATEAARTTEQAITQTTVLPVYSKIDFSKEQAEEKVTDRLLITGGEKASFAFNVSKDNSNTCEVRLNSYDKNTGDLAADVFGYYAGQCWQSVCAGRDTTLYNLGTFKATIPENYFNYEPRQGQQIGTVSTWEGKKILEEMAAVIDADSYE